MQPGGERAAKWIAEQMKTMGLKPLGENGSYLQSVPVTETTLAPETTMNVAGQPLPLGKDRVRSWATPKTVNSAACCSLPDMRSH